MSYDFSDMADAIWFDLGSPSSITPSAIVSRLTSNFFIGKLNNLLDICLSFDSNGVLLSEEDWTTEEQNIYMELYKNNYYAQKIMENLGAGSLGFTTIREGDTTLTKVSPTEIAKTYQMLKTNSDENLKNLVNSYLNNKVRPTSNDFYDINFPNTR